MMRNFFILFTVLFSGIASAAGGLVTLSVTLKPMGSFEAKTSSVFVKGKAEKTKDGYLAENIVVDVSTFKTGIELRDKHMREKYLEVSKFPVATLIKGQAANGVFSGELAVHGVTVPVKGTYEVKEKSLVVNFAVEASSFKISPAKYMGVGVQDEVKVEVSLPIQKGGQ